MEKNELYNYEFVIKEIDSESIKNAKEEFERYKKRGVILNESFDDEEWRFTNEVHQCSIVFRIDELDYERNCREKLNCTYRQYAITMRVVTTLLFGTELRRLRSTIKDFRKLIDVVAGRLEIACLEDKAEVIISFIDLLPLEIKDRSSLFRKNLRDSIEVMVKKDKPESRKSRSLAYYLSYLNFNKHLDTFWEKASEEEKLFYFPVYLWWNMTTILPLRPTEFVLTPRNCITRYDGKTRLTVRRTKLKKERSKSEYKIDKDYELCSYDIPEKLAITIEEYIEKSKESYRSEHNTLFCNQYHHQYLKTKPDPNKSYYKYDDLRGCLHYFYKCVLHEEMGITIKEEKTGIESDVLEGDEIVRIPLGDTRHIAMINLIFSGGNPLVCKELARHASVNISSSYYNNIRTFLEALFLLGVKNRNPNYAIANKSSVFMKPDMPELIGQGRCASEKVKAHDYSECMNAINLYGHTLECKNCKHYIMPRGGTSHDLKQAISDVEDKDRRLRDSFEFLLFTIDSVREGLGYKTDIRSALMTINSTMLEYKDAFTRKYEMEVILNEQIEEQR